jgi:hypothetical protein
MRILKYKIAKVPAHVMRVMPLWLLLIVPSVATGSEIGGVQTSLRWQNWEASFPHAGRDVKAEAAEAVPAEAEGVAVLLGWTWEKLSSRLLWGLQSALDDSWKLQATSLRLYSL